MEILATILSQKENGDFLARADSSKLSDDVYGKEFWIDADVTAEVDGSKLVIGDKYYLYGSFCVGQFHACLMLDGFEPVTTPQNNEDVQ